LSIFAEVVIRIFIPLADFSILTGFITGFNLSMMALPVAALIGVSASYLNASGRFAVPGISVLVFNGTICIYLLLPFINPRNLIFFGAVVVLASVFRLLFQLSFMPETLRIYRGSSISWPEHFIRRFTIGTIGFSVMVGSIIIFRSLHALNGEGEIAAFNYAHKLFELLYSSHLYVLSFCRFFQAWIATTKNLSMTIHAPAF
jgi:peptidoglycan biosynthesis protein MviN/MurJ (putative lipid II flippase)